MNATNLIQEGILFALCCEKIGIPPETLGDLTYGEQQELLEVFDFVKKRSSDGMHVMRFVKIWEAIKNPLTTPAKGVE